MDFGVTEKKHNELLSRMAKCGIKESELEEKFVRSGGPGGQKINKTATCVHLKHIPSGIIVKTQKHRTQRLNRYYARKRLCQLLENIQLGEKSPQALKVEKIRKQKQRRKRRTKSKLAKKDD